MVSAVPTIDVKWPARDFADLQRAMNRAGAELGKSLPQQVRWAGWSIGVTMGTSTRVAPKAITKLKRSGRVAGAEKMYWYRGKRHDGKQFFAQGKTLYEARKHRAAKIHNAGLAKSSWRASIHGLGSGWNVPAKEADGRVKDHAKKYAIKVRQLRGDNPHVVIGSFLRYAVDALKSGEAGISSAISRAASHMEHTIDGVIRKNLAKAAGK